MLRIAEKINFFYWKILCEQIEFSSVKDQIYIIDNLVLLWMDLIAATQIICSFELLLRAGFDWSFVFSAILIDNDWFLENFLY